MIPFSFRRAAAFALAASFLFLTACGRTVPAPAEPDAVPAVPTPPADTVTVLIPEEQAGVLSSVDGASVLRSFALLHAVAAEIPADALPALSAAADVTVAAVFTAPLADTEAADAILHADDLVYRAADPMDGDGTVIAVIDSAFDADHPAFSLPTGASPAITEEIFADLVFDTNAALIALTEKKTEEDVLALRLSDKIPFAYDYAGRDGDVSSARADHGTHVAALAAGGGVKPGTLPGAAPAAQLLLMKVFDDRGESCSEADLLAAIEDAVLLGADVINLSLGVPAAGQSALSMTYLARAIDEAEAAGVTVVAAAGNDGASGRGGLHGDLMHTGNPDTGLPSEPAVYENVLGVGASLNGVEYAPFITLADGDRIRCTVTAEETAGTSPGFASALGGKSLPVIPVPGVGTPEDFAYVDVRDAIALVRRGEITFAEKISHAADAGAVGVIVYNTPDGDDFRMSAPGASIPAVSVSYEDGAALAALAGEKITVSAVLAAFPTAGGDAIADFSARGPAADLTLSPEITAVGDNVLSAVSGGGYGVMSGTSMAAPQIAGLAAACIARSADTLSALQEADRPAAVRAALMSAAVPVFAPDSGLPYSPRMQGAGRLAAGADPAKMTVTVTDGEGRAAVSLGDHLPGEGGSVRFTVRIENTGAETETLSLSAQLTAEGYTEHGGKTYVTETPVAAPAEITFSRKTVTLRPGETAAVTVTVTPDPAFLTAQDAVFLNGFYLEGTVTAARADGVAFSIPFFGFCGDFDAAPMLDGGDWDGYESYYGLQSLHLVNRDGTRRDAGEESALFAFSPNGDGIADSVEWEIYPLRHIAGVQLQIFNDAGEEVCVDAASGIMKSYVSEGKLLGHRLPIWDGTDGLNSHFVWPDGQYTVRLTLRSFSGKTETAEIPLKIDTAAPEITLTESGGYLTAAATDAGTLCALRIWAPDPEDSEGTLTEAKSARRASAVTLSAKIPEDADYLYVRAEDMAGNVTVLRYYTDTAAEAEEEAAA